MSATTAEEAPTATPPAPLDRRRRNLAFAVISGGMLLAALDGTIVSTALPTIVGDLGGATHMSWVVTAYLLTQTVSTALAGKFGDIFGRKRIFLIAVVIFVGASALCGMATGMTWLIVARGLQGIGGGALAVTSTAIVADIIPLRERGRYQGAIGAVFGMATVIGPLLGGWLTDNASWRWVFYVNVPVAALLIPAAIFLLPETKAQKRPIIDYLGIGAIASGASCLILATSWGGTQYPWGSATIIGLFIAGAVLLTLFVFIELRAASPLLPMRLFKQNVFATSTALSFIVGFALMGCMTFIPTYLQYVLGVSATMSGVTMLPMVVGLMIASIFAGNTVSTTGIYKPFPVVGSIVMGLGMWLLSRLGTDPSFWVLAGTLFVLGVGIGLSMQVLIIIVQATVDYADLGVATSGVTFLRTLGQAFGAAVFGTIYANLLDPRLKTAIVQAKVDPKKITTPAAVHNLPPEQSKIIIAAYADALSQVFLYAAPVALIALAAALMLKTVPLRGIQRGESKDLGRGFASPDDRDSKSQLEAKVASQLRRLAHRWYDDLATETDPDVAHTWVVVIVAIGQQRTDDALKASDLARVHYIPLTVIEPALEEAHDAGLVSQTDGTWRLTKAGEDLVQSTAQSLVAAIKRQIEDDRGKQMSSDEADDLGSMATQVATQWPEVVMGWDSAQPSAGRELAGSRS